MKPSVKAKWVAALRSGKYVQGRGRLHNASGGKFCCLGVLCDLYKRGHPKAEWVDGFFHPFGINDARESDSQALPVAVQAWAGLHAPNPAVNDQGSLAGLNDDGQTFDAIADVIEEQI